MLGLREEWAWRIYGQAAILTRKPQVFRQDN